MIKTDDKSTRIDVNGLLQLATELRRITNASFNVCKEAGDGAVEFLTLAIISSLATNRANLNNDKFVMPTLNELELFKDMAKEIEKSILLMARSMEEQQGVK